MKKDLAHARPTPRVDDDNDDDGDSFQAEPEPEPEPLSERDASRPRKRAAAAGAVAQTSDGKKSRGDNEETTETATEPIKAFLGTIKEGWGDKFGASFAAEGLEQDEDLGALGTPAYQDALRSLLERLLQDGAKKKGA